MAKKFADLRAAMSPAAQASAAKRTGEMLAEMPLQELRQARKLTQKALADILHVEQPAIAKMEKRTDMYISTLRNLLRAMGGDLVVTAKFPDGAVDISNFRDIVQSSSLDDLHQRMYEAGLQEGAAAEKAARSPSFKSFQTPRIA